MRHSFKSVAVLTGLLLLAVPAWADEVEEALRAGSQALLGKDMDRAIDHFRRAMTVGRPNRVQMVTAHSGLCASRYKKSMINKDSALTQKAVTDCDAAIRLKSDYQSVYRMRGIAYLTLGNLERAIEDLNIAVALEPDDYLAVQNRGLAKAKLGYSQSAIFDFDRSIQLKPNHPWGYYNRGRLHAASSQHQKALDDFDTFIRFKQGFEPVYLHRGVSQMSLGQYQEAAESFNEAIHLRKGKNPQGLLRRGSALYLAGRYGEAIQDIERAVDLDPDTLEYRFWLHLVRGRLNQSIRNIFPEARGESDTQTWPGVMAAHLTGRVEAHTVMNVIDRMPKKPGQEETKSLATYLIGEWADIQDQTRVARKWMNILAKDTKNSSPWSHSARMQVKRLDRLLALRPKEPRTARPAEEPFSIVRKSAEPREQNRERRRSWYDEREPARPAERARSVEPARSRQASHTGMYVFKVASFQDIDNADKALVEVTDMGYEVYLQEVMVKGDRYLRVWVGPFSSMREANAARNRVKTLPGYHPTKVLRR
ncbi:MAG: tetratricopeptide repeat protein [Magnetococcales bacterium]|nr:tetratricopeptide repeat protein [Magnetococcales bacterium]